MGLPFYLPRAMMRIREFMVEDHRHCDDLFVSAEQLANSGDLAAARQAFEDFSAATFRHFATEEQTLFPAFEAQTGMRMGPTQVMRMEHQQMRSLMDAAKMALQTGAKDDFLAQAETLLIMLQQHNMKEENVLYPMCDQHLAAAEDALLTQMRADLAAV